MQKRGFILLVAGIVVVVALIAIVSGAQVLIGSNATLSIRDAWVRPADQRETTAAYLTIDNETAETVSLTGAQSPVAERVELHQTIIEDNMARMTMLETLEIPARETVQIAPSGVHIMLVGLNRDLVEGETIPLSLTFETGETVEVTAQVQMNALESP